ncbi:MAG: hypothetical protein CMG67_02040 [Candidatus Marinimicrobia bacterium]|nr:hypothetical protein [Candidatus Neomarinimicrobiota bacterium]|tara:strand:- start:8751 stop:9926 length:1176 start_codon:yes stop_codon:yes gene_type:complete
MKKKIAILGSTGSIGKTSLEILKKDLKKFKIFLLTANSNYSLILKQINKYKPDYFIINDFKVFERIKKLKKKNKVIILNKFSEFSLKKFKIDITISGIVGIAGLEPTIKFTKISKKILLANKETVICGWHILKKISEKYKTSVVPIDSEHFSINELTKNFTDSEIDKIYITGSGGPFLRKPFNKFKSIKASDAIKHPKWQMGKKISVDSSTLMNKVLEVLEAFKLFQFSKEKYNIVIHPQSLIHAIVFFSNGQAKFLYHTTDMKIPIGNAIYNNKINIKKILSKKMNNFKDFNHLKFEQVDKKKFPIVTLLKKNIFNNSAPIILNASNEVLVNQFLKKKIPFNSIYPYLKRVFKDKDYKKYAIKTSPSIKEIYDIDNWARNKTLSVIRNKR